MPKGSQYEIEEKKEEGEEAEEGEEIATAMQNIDCEKCCQQRTPILDILNAQIRTLNV
jgi:hypothetical protein